MKDGSVIIMRLLTVKRLIKYIEFWFEENFHTVYISNENIDLPFTVQKLTGVITKFKKQILH